MRELTGASREQMEFWSLEDLVSEDAMVRVIDRFIDVTDLAALGFYSPEPKEVGRLPYSAAGLAKLYVYGYESGIRSSRKLAREACRNVEVMWLLGKLKPSYKTIAEFRRINIEPLSKLFRTFVTLCRSWNLVGGTLAAVDGTKIKASNNKKRNFSRKKVERWLAEIDKQVGEYFAAMDEADRQESDRDNADVKELLERREKFEGYLNQLDETGENEISETDPDARLMGNNRGGVEVAYNVQSTVDGERHFIVDFEVLQNPSDQGQLAYMAWRLRQFGYKGATLLADKGYFNGADLEKVKKYRIKAIVARQRKSDPKDQPEQFHNDQFVYDANADTYQCPMGQTLETNSAKAAKRRNYFNKAACAACPHRADCTRGKRGWRAVTRSEYGDIYDEADRIFKANKKLYKLRQQIVEHPFGTIKHAMNGGYFLLRTRRKVRCEVALLFLGYNLKRAMKVLGFKEIMAKLGAISPAFCAFFKNRTERWKFDALCAAA